nr:extracellular serine proteinase-like [Lytechinus pictus]
MSKILNRLWRARIEQRRSKMKLIVVILSALVVATSAKNATFYTVEEAIKDHYIVVLKPGYDVEVIKKLLLTDLSGSFGDVSIKHTYTAAINGFSAKLTNTALQKLLAREEIKYITEDGEIHPAAVASWGLDRIDQRSLPLDGAYKAKGCGSGVNVYVVDSGIYPDHLYYEGRASPAFDAVNDGRPFGIDCLGHGTHCAGTIGASMYGVAPNVNIYGLRVLDCSGSGQWSSLIAACDYLVNFGVKPAVASMSIGGPANTAADEAVQRVIQSGISVVASARNANSPTSACSSSPARVQEAITVGATDINDRRADYSNYGTCVDLFAPGNDIKSLWIRKPDDTRTQSGTSVSTTHVTGAVALLLAKNPNLSPADIKATLIDTSTKNAISDLPSDTENRLLYVPRD